MNAIIVDDTPTAIDTLAAKLGKYGDITLAATATNGSDGIELVKKHKPDLQQKHQARDPQLGHRQQLNRR